MTHQPPSITVIGRANIDLTTRVPYLPSAGRAAFGPALAATAGGKALNQAVAIARLGGRAQLVAFAGTDSWGEQLRNTVLDSGVDVTYFQLIDGATTAAAIIQVTPDGESYVTLALSPATELTADAVSDALTLHHPQIVVTQLDLPPGPVNAAIQRRNSALSIGNLIPHPDFDRRLLPNLDALIVNEHEAADILEMSDIDPIEAATRLRQVGPDIIVITAGRKGAYYNNRGEIGHVAAEEVDVVDTSGAGDAFLAAFVLELSRSGDVPKAATAATRIASRAVQQPGALLPAAATAWT